MVTVRVSLSVCKKGRLPYPMRSAGGVLISLSRPWARRWTNHWSLRRMASATPELRLPSQLQDITTCWPVPNYTAWWQRHMCVNNLPKVVTWKRNGRDSNPRPFESQVQRCNHYDTRPNYPCWKSKMTWGIVTQFGKHLSHGRLSVCIDPEGLDQV